MAKKRQLDFHKVKLRAGRTLPKGTNVTNTAFKSKKILVRQELLKQKLKSIKRNLEEHLKLAHHHNSSIRCNAFQCIKSYILENEDKYLLELHHILPVVCPAIMDQDTSVRHVAIDALCSILQLTSSEQLDSYFRIILSNLCCAMTHSAFVIRKDSLELFLAISTYHPGLICHSFTVLQHLLDMISKSGSDARSGRQKIILRTVINDKIKSSDWHMFLMNCFHSFFKAMLKYLFKSGDCIDNDEDSSEEQHVSESNLLSGSSVNSLKSVWYWHFKSDTIDSLCKNSDEFAKLISNVVPVVLSVFDQLTHKAQGSECHFSRKTLQQLKTIVEVLCFCGEWTKLISDFQNKLDVWFKLKFYNLILEKLMLKFPYSCIGSANDELDTAEQVVCLKLNLRILQLFSSFLLGIAPEDITTNALTYLESAFELDYEMCYQCIPLILKIVSNCLKACSNDVCTQNMLLRCLCNLVKVSDHRPNAKLLQSFIMDLTLAPDNGIVLECPSMKVWFCLLPYQLQEMVQTNVVDVPLLTYIRKHVARRLPPFMEAVQSIGFEQFLEFLHFEDEDFQETIGSLIPLLENISYDRLQCISKIILNPSYPCKVAMKVVQSLALGFSSRNKTRNEHCICCFFILNVLFDNNGLGEEEKDPIFDDFVERYDFVREISSFQIMPSTLWKKHCSKHEACISSLMLFPLEAREISIISYLKSCVNRMDHPVQIVIAIFKILNNTSSKTIRDAQLTAFIFHLTFSSLLYMSVITSVKDGSQFGVSELISSINFTQATAFDTMKHIEDSLPAVSHEGIIFYFLRIVRFFITERLLTLEHREIVLPLLRKFKAMDTKDKLGRTPLWIYMQLFFKIF